MRLFQYREMCSTNSSIFLENIFFKLIEKEKNPSYIENLKVRVQTKIMSNYFQTTTKNFMRSEFGILAKAK